VPNADFTDASDDYRLREAALLTVTDSMRGEIFACLSKAYGDENKLYSRMAKTNHPPTRKMTRTSLK